jgi:hypothetical protein
VCNAKTLGEVRSISRGLMEGSAADKGVTGPGEACTTISPVREAATGSQFKYPGLGAKADSVSAAGNKTYSKCHSAERLFKDCPLRGAVDESAWVTRL